MKANFRVVVKVSCFEAYFDFEFASEAAEFAKTLLEHSAGCDDTEQQTEVTMLVTKKSANKGED